MAIKTLTIDDSACQCNSIVTIDCNGNAICQDLCELVRNCPSLVRQRLRFFGDLVDTPAICSPNKILGTDGACAGVVMLDPCVLFATCGFTDNLVRSSATDLASGVLDVKLRVCAGGSLTLIKRNPSTVNEFLELCYTPTPGVNLLVDTGDGPGAYPNCTVNGVPRPGMIQSKADQTGWQVTCPVVRAIARLTFDTSAANDVNLGADGFFIPNGTWNISATSSVSFVTLTYAGLNVPAGSTGVNAGIIVPRTGWYTVGMKGVMKYSHGIHTVRAQVTKLTAGNVIVDPPLLDDRFEGPIFRDAGMEDSFYGDNALDGVAFTSQLSVTHFDGNLVRGIAGFGFGQSKPVFLTANERVVFIVKFSSGVSGETYSAAPKVGVHGENDNGMTNGLGPGTEIWLIEEPELYYPIP